jgi:hypothetical protein
MSATHPEESPNPDVEKSTAVAKEQQAQADSISRNRLVAELHRQEAEESFIRSLRAQR